MTVGKKRSANQGSYTDDDSEKRSGQICQIWETANNMYILGKLAKFCTCQIFHAIR